MSHTNEKPQVTKRGIFDMQVCVPKTWDDELVKAFADSHNEAGTEHGWLIRKAGDAALRSDPERQPCSDRPEFVHIMLDC